MIKGGKEFISWNTSSIIQRAQLFFEGGGPYDFLRNYQINFDEIRIIRNSIAHKSKNAKRKFEEFIKNKLPTKYPKIKRVGQFLLEINPEANTTFLSDYIKIIKQVANKVANY